MESSEKKEEAGGDGHAQASSSGPSPAEKLAQQCFILTMIGVVLYVGAVFLFGQ